VSAVGWDDLGDRALDELRAHGVMTDCVARLRGYPTGRVNVTLDHAKVPTFEIRKDAAWDYIPWGATLETLARRVDAVCFGTLGQRSTQSRDAIMRFLRATRESALRVLDLNLRQDYFDAAGVERSLELASALKLNDHELTVLAALCGTGASPTPATLKSIARRYDLRLVALTRGPAGAVLVAGDAESTELPPPVRVVDTVGAGDAFTAAMVCDFLRGASLGLVNRHANEIAAFICSVPGATGTEAGPTRHSGGAATSFII
jgi:fructokinase